MSSTISPASVSGRTRGRRRVLCQMLAVLPLLGGCVSSGPPPPSVTLPPGAVQGAGDPTRAAIISASYAFANPGTLTGRPADAARAVANYEYLTVELSDSPQWSNFSPLVGLELKQGLPEVRNAVGIAPGAPPQLVVNALYAAASALSANDVEAARRALQPPLFPAGGEATLARLSNLPRLPQAAFATSLASREMNRLDQQGGGRGPLLWPGL